MTTMLLRQAKLLSHIIGWLLLSFVVLFYHPLTWGITLPIRFWLKQILLLGMLMGVFYFNITAYKSIVLCFVLVPKNQYLCFALATVVCCPDWSP